MNLDRIRKNGWTDKIVVMGRDECWLWQRSTGSHGYGQVHDGNTTLLAHRVAYTMEHGEIPEAMTVDHICKVKRCVNPQHLRLLSNQENGRRNGKWERTHCKRGHPFSLTNTYFTKRGWRNCRVCRRLTRKD